MNDNQTPDTAALAGVLAEEARLEHQLLPFGIALDINAELPAGIKYQKYTHKLRQFIDAGHPLPQMLVCWADYCDEFCQAYLLEGDEALGAKRYLAWRIWKEKEVFVNATIKERIVEAKRIRQERKGLNIAVSRHVKNAPLDGYPHYLKSTIDKFFMEAHLEISRKLMKELSDHGLAIEQWSGREDDRDE